MSLHGLIFFRTLTSTGLTTTCNWVVSTAVIFTHEVHLGIHILCQPNMNDDACKYDFQAMFSSLLSTMQAVKN